jgi:hypothetical protein
MPDKGFGKKLSVNLTMLLRVLYRSFACNC